MKQNIMGIVSIALVGALVVFVVWGVLHVFGSGAPSAVGTDATQSVQAPPDAAAALPAFSGKFTEQAVVYHVESEAVFDRRGPIQKATCMWPNAESPIYKRIDLITDTGTVTWKPGVQHGGIIAIHIWVNQPADITIQLQPWGSDCSTSAP